MKRTLLVAIIVMTASFSLVARNQGTGAIEILAASPNLGIIVSLNGNVGIGTPNPTEKLDVSGKIALDGVVIAYRPTSMDGTLILGDGGRNLSHSSGADGYYNTFVGMGVGIANTAGQYNAAMGYAALYSNTTGAYNSAMGTSALYSNTTGWHNSAMGNSALFSNTTGYYNAAMGAYALYSNTTGQSNAAMGTSALYSNTTGQSNSAMGAYALYYNTTGWRNAAMGGDALRFNTTGMYNSAMGMYALYSNTTGASNAAMGNSAGYNALGNKNTFMGSNSDIQGGLSLNNATAIGYNAKVATSNALVLGGLGADAVRVGIGTATPSYSLEVVGTVNASAFMGDGSLLTGIIIAGTITNNYNGGVSINGTLSANEFVGNGAGLIGTATGLTVATATVAIDLMPAVTINASSATLALSDKVVLSNASGGNIVLTLPSVSSSTGRVFRVIKTDSSMNTITISGDGNISGESSFVLRRQFGSVSLLSEGAIWIVVESE